MATQERTLPGKFNVRAFQPGYIGEDAGGPDPKLVEQVIQDYPPTSTAAMSEQAPKKREETSFFEKFFMDPGF